MGDGICSCDIDVTPGGLGAFKGQACEACLSDNFYGENCRTCPNLQVVQCIPGLNLTEIPGVGQCIQSCGAKTCNSIGRCGVYIKMDFKAKNNSNTTGEQWEEKY